jgi:hypothetical protein
MDKSIPKWKNVPPPARNTPITILGTCFHISMSGDLCVDLDSITLPSAIPMMSTVDSPMKDATVGSRRKFSARAPPRTVLSGDAKRENEKPYGF